MRNFKFFVGLVSKYRVIRGQQYIYAPYIPMVNPPVVVVNPPRETVSHRYSSIVIDENSYTTIRA